MGATVTVPAVIYLVSVSALFAKVKPQGWVRTYGVPVVAALVLVSSWSEQAPLLTGLLVASLLAAALTTHFRSA